MGNRYAGGTAQLQRDPEKPYHDRQFKLVLLESEQSEFEVEDVTLGDVLDKDRNFDLNTVALRTQEIKDPTRPFASTDRILQFFVEDNSRDAIRRRPGLPGVLFEVEEGDADEDGTVIEFVSSDDVGLMISGEGYAVPLREDVDLSTANAIAAKRSASEESADAPTRRPARKSSSRKTASRSRSKEK